MFGPSRVPVRDVMAGGIWIVRDGHHVAETEVFARYRAALARIDKIDSKLNCFTAVTRERALREAAAIAAAAAGVINP